MNAQHESTTEAAADAGTGAPADPGQYLAFRVGPEEYAVGVLKVTEIIGLLPITPIPKQPRSVMGVVNLRGRVLPVVDMLRRFEMGELAPTEKTCIIVVEVERTAGRTAIGIAVDEVAEVFDLVVEQIDETPELGAGVDMSFVAGVGKLEQRLVMLLDIDAALGGDEVLSAEAAA